jgi:hypothetical protein
MTMRAFSKSAVVRWGLCFAGLAGCLSPLAAQAWTRIGETQRENNIRRVWEMQDLKTPDAEGVRSRRYLNEYDCTYKMHRLGQMTSYAGPKLTGEKIANVKEMGYWRKIPPNGVFVLTYIAVCIE